MLRNSAPNPEVEFPSRERTAYQQGTTRSLALTVGLALFWVVAGPFFRDKHLVFGTTRVHALRSEPFVRYGRLVPSILLFIFGHFHSGVNTGRLRGLRNLTDKPMCFQ